MAKLSNILSIITAALLMAVYTVQAQNETTGAPTSVTVHTTGAPTSVTVHTTGVPTSAMAVPSNGTALDKTFCETLCKNIYDSCQAECVDLSRILRYACYAACGTAWVTCKAAC